MAAQNKVINLENVRIGFRNFEGREGDYNKAGDRSFVAFLDEQTARELHAEGWNVKFPKEQPDRTDPDQEAREPYLHISVGFANFPANVFIISEGKDPVKLYEEDVSMLDWAELETVDLVIRPYHWSVRNDSGIKAYLKNGYFTIVTDRFASKYGL
jgi:hypothetical protein